MFILIENGEIFAPEPLGKKEVLTASGNILKIGAVDRRALDALGVEVNVIDAKGCVVTPGFIDPHQHLLGGSGEDGFSTQTPEIHFGEIAAAGITTVVGCLGVDTTMKTMAGLLAKAKALKEEGLNAYVWTGGYHVPPATITRSISEDIMFIEEVIGTGEIAVSDERSTAPAPRELARLVKDTHNGGMLSRKAGVTHFHVGCGKKRLAPLRELIEEFEIDPCWLYPTHVERDEKLMLEAIELAKQGCFVDIDVVDGGLERWFKFYLENGGTPDRLTVSTDASIASPRNLHEQIRECVLGGYALEQILPPVTENTARVLRLEHKGRLAAGKAADLLVLDKKTLEIKHVVSAGRHIVAGEKLLVKENFLDESNRDIRLKGEKA